MYKCVSKNYHPVEYVREKENIHGAKNDVRETVEALELQFSFTDHMNRRNDTPRVIHSVYTFCTTDTSIGNNYTVGQEYSELPK